MSIPMRIIKFLQKSKLHPKLIAFLTFIIDELMMIGRFLYRIFMVIALAYPFKYFWNEIAVNFGVPTISHIDTAIAILSIIFIVGWVFNMMKKNINYCPKS